ncbi:Crp/Fnr family transcriptional regulator [Deinococcus maricopensis]|uniref:Transcriptional regulator, Crp/Fnr family n=1 Tax=Deinococcus maricopensis (strain DSM 21211 / LMG 22137 / NRRL B-23946 / LB-34) TaxID=709986 RepID=E8U3L0_DEIML|nr:Crp/Fnr family transcriptional regulator [Deinococcus maricopensis]ADV68634.1 transcriptional regulator, Crp/Fnr family [Deinococcus maricopensis DSM 21211]
MNYPSLVWHLKRTELFADFELAELERVATSTPYRSYQPGEVIYRMDDPADALYFVRSGLVKISKLFPNGKEAILSVIGQHDTFGELLLDAEERRPTQAEALEATTLIVLPRTELQKLLDIKPALAMKLIRLMAARLFEAQAWTAEVSAYSAPERVASLLYRLAREFGKPHPNGVELGLRLNQEDIARMVGATRETVSHSLGRLKQEGAIVRPRTPIVVKMEALRNFLEQ